MLVSGYAQALLPTMYLDRVIMVCLQPPPNGTVYLMDIQIVPNFFGCFTQ